MSTEGGIGDRPEARTTRRRLLRNTAAGAAVGVAAPWFARDDAVASARRVDEANEGSELAMSGDGMSESRLGRMRAAMERHVEQGTVPGLVAAISRRGEAHVEAVGMMAFDGGAPMRRDAIFRVASVTKPIAATAAMILVEECVLRLDDPVDAFLPELADRRVLRAIDAPLADTLPANRPITLRDLLTFRSGYGAIFAPPEQSPLAAALIEAGVAAGPLLPTLPPDDYMARFGALPLAHQPGDQWLYNAGSDMVGVLIARATGGSFGAFLEERIFAPLGMKDTAFSVPADKRDRLPTAYWTDFATGEFGVFDAGAGDSRFARPNAFESGASGLVSTVDDLLAFGELMLNQGTYRDVRLLSRPAVELMTTDHITPEQKATSASTFFPGFWDNHGWGFGVAVNTRRDNLWETPGRYGWDGGYGTSWYVDPTEGVIGVLLTQRLWDGTQVGVLNDFWTTAYQAIAD